VSRTIRALIVDDEPLARRGIRQLLARHPDIVVAAECRNGQEALRALERLHVDLVFLDVQMPELDGFAVIRNRGAARMPLVVMVTAYDAYAVRAFEAHAVDYLVKPVSDTRFDDALVRVRKRIEADDALLTARRLSALLEDATRRGVKPPAPRLPPRVVVPSASGDLVFDASEVDWIEADDYYAAIHVRGRRHLLRESLGSLAARLEDAHFVRVHRSAIVNVERIRELRAVEGEVILVLRDGAEVPVSRRRREAVHRVIREMGRR
jgi:two-component system LytT family response regulator